MIKRVSTRIPEEIAQKIEEYAAKYGLTQSQLMAMSIQAGLSSIIRSLEPENAFSADQWAAITLEMMKKGYTLEEQNKKE